MIPARVPCLSHEHSMSSESASRVRALCSVLGVGVTNERTRRKRSGRPCGHGSGAWPAAEGCNAASDAPAGTAAAAAAAATGGGGAAPPCSSTSSMGGCSTHATISPIEMHGSVHLGRAPALRELRVARDGGGHLLSGVGRAQEYGRREGLTRHGACLH